MICSSNVFFINNKDPNPDPELRLKPDPDTNPTKFISDTKHWFNVYKTKYELHSRAKIIFN